MWCLTLVSLFCLNFKLLESVCPQLSDWYVTSIYENMSLTVVHLFEYVVPHIVSILFHFNFRSVMLDCKLTLDVELNFSDEFC
jgi:hypothetical protein